MKNVIRHLAAAGLLALGAGSAFAGTTVNYIDPDRFSDVPFATWERDEVLKELTDHFSKLGAQLPPGQNLRVDVKDVDLAGREYPTRGVRDLRVVRSNGVDWPRIDLQYTVEQDGQVLRSGAAVQLLPELTPKGFSGDQLYAVYLENRFLPPKVRVFIDYLVETTTQDQLSQGGS